MADYAHKMTDREIEALQRRLEKEYAQAEREVREKAEKYMERFKERDLKKWRELKDGKITNNEYVQWRANQMAVGKRWEDMRDTLAKDYAHTNQIARDIVRGKAPDVYALNHNFGTYQVESGGQVNTGYTLYDRNTVLALMKDNPQLLPNPGKATSDRIYNGLDVRWNRQQLQSVAMQGLLQGESIPKIAERLANTVGEKNKNAAIRNARTMMTSAQNKGRLDSYKRAQDLGIDLKKEWQAAHDGRTRHWHADLDGVSVPVDEPFVNDYGEIDYPGDPGADPANVYNCRCTMKADIQKVKSYSERLKEYKKAGTMSYEEWRDDKIKEGLLNKRPTAYDNMVKRDLSNAKYIEPYSLDEKLTDNQMIRKVAHEVDGNGRCASLAYAYLGNRMGLDVEDFRDDTRYFFGTDEATKRILQFKGVKGEFIKDNGLPSTQAALDVMSRMGNKEYILGAGNHSAIVKTHNGQLQFLELQAGSKSSGWKDFDANIEDTLLQRFNSDMSASVYAIETKTLEKSAEFKQMLGYVNGA